MVGGRCYLIVCTCTLMRKVVTPLDIKDQIVVEYIFRIVLSDTH